MKKLILLGLVLAGILFCCLACGRKGEPTLADLGGEIGVTFAEAGKFKVSKNILRPGDRQTFRTLKAEKSDRFLKVEITSGIDVKDAESTIAERQQMIGSLFTNLPSPYPGVVTNNVEVGDELTPRLHLLAHGNQELILYILPSNVRFTYGALTEELVAYWGGLLFLYEPASRTLYRFDYFVPKAQFDEAEVVGFFTGLRFSSGAGVGVASVAVPPAVSQTPAPAPDSAPTSAAAVRPDSLRRPGYNLIVIAFEPLGANHVGCYGYPKDTTPNLDAFAKDAFFFADTVSPSSWSLPVFMSWVTSLYPSQHKVINKYSTYTKKEQILANLEALSPGTVTLPQVMQHNGYRTAGFTGGASLVGDFGFREGFEEYYDAKRLAGFDLTMPMAINWLTRTKPEKFFLFVQGYDVHGQFPLDRKYLAPFLVPPYKGAVKGTEEEYWQLRDKSVETGRVELAAEDLRLWKAIYDAKIFAADQRFGTFIKHLRELDLLDNSVIVVSSGSGNEYLEHGRIDHGFSLYEELIHVPLLIRVPGEKGRVEDLVRTLDIMPTALDLLGLPVDQALAGQMRGVSLVPVMNGAHPGLDGISETDYLLRSFKRSIKTSDGWKLIVSLDTEERELYNLNDDPGEHRNLIAENGRLAYELEQRLFSRLKAPAAGR